MNLFEEYVRNYDFSDSDISYKYKHTLRVQNLCEAIAKDLDFNERDIYLASLCGLFHDVGRFEQDKRYNSFRDNKVFDHGDYGYELFLKEFAPKLDLNEEEMMIIAKSILYHNKLAIGKCDEKEKVFCKITRDADKLDILYVFADGILKLEQPDGEISPACREYFMKHSSVPRNEITNNTEETIVKLAFIWDINFDASLKIIKENKYFERIEKYLNKEIFNDYFEEIKKYLKDK